MALVLLVTGYHLCIIECQFTRSKMSFFLSLCRLNVDFLVDEFGSHDHLKSIENELKEIAGLIKYLK